MRQVPNLRVFKEGAAFENIRDSFVELLDENDFLLNYRLHLRAFRLSLEDSLLVASELLNFRLSNGFALCANCC